MSTFIQPIAGPNDARPRQLPPDRAVDPVRLYAAYRLGMIQARARLKVEHEVARLDAVLRRKTKAVLTKGVNSRHVTHSVRREFFQRFTAKLDI